MAEAKGRQKDDPAAGGTGAADLVKGFLAAVLIGILGGGAFGYFAVPVGPPAAAATQTSETAEKAPLPGRFPADALEIPVPSVIVDLGQQPPTRVRLDVSLIAAHGTSETSSLASEVREDIIAFLKGLTVADIEGVRGFQNLREELDDRARVRGRGAILGILIGGLVLE
jgi:flagellar FliL protein